MKFEPDKIMAPTTAPAQKLMLSPHDTRDGTPTDGTNLSCTLLRLI